MDTKEFMTKYECEQHMAQYGTDITVLKASYSTVANLMKVLIGVTIGGFTGIIATILTVVLQR